jgi:hypothetical protein
MGAAHAGSGRAVSSRKVLTCGISRETFENQKCKKKEKEKPKPKPENHGQPSGCVQEAPGH